jgi:signal transduction histidine kinase
MVARSFAFSAMFAIPTALASWLFGWRGAGFSMAGCLLLFFVVNTLFVGSILWPFPLILACFIGLLMLGIVAFGISFMRAAWDLAHNARRQAQAAQEQMALACERQRHLDQMKDHFLLHISHELRTPLTMVRGYLELLYEQGNLLDGQTQQRMLNFALSGCDDLQHLADSVLEVSQVEYTGRQPQLEEIVLADLVRTLMTTIDPRHLQEREVLIAEIPDHLVVLANRQYLRQILGNLLSNAFKYTPAHTPIHISAVAVDCSEKTVAPTGAAIRVCVCDAGPGIPPEHIPLLFHKFVRLERDVGGPISGTGLGLYICQQLVNAMGGRIWVESSGVAGEGCRFYFTLQRACQVSV